MRPTASFFPKTSSTECTDPSRAEMKMKSTANQLLRRKGGIQQRIFLQKLTKRGIGTFKAEIVARSVAKDCCFRNKEHVRRKILNYIMKAKVEDAEDVVKAEDYKHHKMKKELSKEIPNTDILRRFQRFCHEEAELEWGKKKEKDEKKRKHLVDWNEVRPQSSSA